ncbi:MAG: immunity 49 family protein [Rhodocyclales bacterium]|nr:immunity 49 family protein [Rhodocyclales bacterium]
MKNVPEQEQIDHWLNNARKGIEDTRRLHAEGFYERENISLQAVLSGYALDYATLGRARFLNGEPLEDAREEFAEAARHQLKIFTIAYDETDPDYQGSKADLSCVSETLAIDAMNYALMAADFALAAEFAGWYRTSPDGYMLGVDINRYTHALAFTIRDRSADASALLQAQLQDYANKTPKSPAARNYHTLITTLSGIVDGDNAKFNDGLLAQLKFYDHQAHGEYRNTDQGFICDAAVALANLALHRGLRVMVEYDTLPQGLLIQPSSANSFID